MNSDSTHKVVVGIVLAAVFGVGVSVFAVRMQHENEAARNAPPPAPIAPADQNATDAAAPAQNATGQSSTEPPAASSAAPSTAAAIAPTPVDPNTSTVASNSAKDAAGNQASDASKQAKSKSSDRADRHTAKTRNGGDGTGTRVASASGSSASPADQSGSSSESTAPAPGAANADAQQAAAQTGQETAIGAGPTATSVEPTASDSQITASVKSEIATAAPNTPVDVTTTNGVVALAGSVPSQDAVDQAKQAAQQVPGVKHVDTSALVVSNQ